MKCSVLYSSINKAVKNQQNRIFSIGDCLSLLTGVGDETYGRLICTQKIKNRICKKSAKGKRPSIWIGHKTIFQQGVPLPIFP